MTDARILVKLGNFTGKLLGNEILWLSQSKINTILKSNLDSIDILDQKYRNITLNLLKM